MSPRRDEHSVINTHESSAPGARAGAPRGKAGQKLRYVRKDGHCNAAFQQASGEWGHYVTDIFTTLVEIRWRVMLLIFSLSYILSWLSFGLLYWLIAYVHGEVGDPDVGPCVENVRSFTAAFLYSMETQATIGYGFRGMGERCMVAIVVVTVQDVLSCFIDTFVIGIAVAKMASPRKRAQTVGFSSRAVVSLRDGTLCLLWRVGDFRGNHILEGTAWAQVVRHEVLPSGDVSVSYQDMDIQCRDIALAMPATIVHKLEPGSPLYGMSPGSLAEEDFELVVTFTYTDDSTGVLHQTRSSYTPAEIRWGQRFQDMLREGKNHYHVDFALFHQTVWAQVPMVSAQERDRTTPQAESGQSRVPSLRSHTKRIRLSGPAKVQVQVSTDTYQEARL